MLKPRCERTCQKRQFTEYRCQSLLDGNPPCTDSFLIVFKMNALLNASEPQSDPAQFFHMSNRSPITAVSIPSAMARSMTPIDVEILVRSFINVLYSTYVNKLGKSSLHTQSQTHLRFPLKQTRIPEGPLSLISFCTPFPVRLSQVVMARLDSSMRESKTHFRHKQLISLAQSLRKNLQRKMPDLRGL